MTFLLSQGANASLKTNKGETPRDLAKTPEMLQLFHDAALRNFLKLFPLELDFREGFLAYKNYLEGLQQSGATLGSFARKLLFKQRQDKIVRIYEQHSTFEFLEFLRMYAETQYQELLPHIIWKIQTKMNALEQEWKTVQPNESYVFQQLLNTYKSRRDRDLFETEPTYRTREGFKQFLINYPNARASLLWKSLCISELEKISAPIKKSYAALQCELHTLMTPRPTCSLNVRAT